MTTIAFKNGVLAADTQGTLGGFIRHQAELQKIYTPPEDDYWEVNGVRVIAYGFAGDFTKRPYIDDLLRANLTHLSTLPPDVDLDVAAIIILETGDSYLFSTYPTRTKQELKVYPMPGPLAIGSGETFAMAAMGVGSTAMEAVAVAMKHDIGTGGSIVSFVVPPAPEVPSKRPVKEPPIKTYTVEEVNELLRQEREQALPAVPSDSGVKPAKEVEQQVH